MSGKTFNCFDCGEEIFFHPNVKRQDRPDKLQPLTQRYSTIPQNAIMEQFYHVCGKKQPAYDYQDKKIAVSSDEKKSPQKLNIISNEVIKTIQEDIKYTKELLEATIKALDQILTTNNKQGILFTTAKNIMSGQTGNKNTENPGEKVEKTEEEEEEEEEQE